MRPKLSFKPFVRSPDVWIVAIAVAFPLTALFTSTAHVSENDSQLPPVVVESAPPLAAFAHMTSLKASTRFSLDVIDQPRLGDVIVATGAQPVMEKNATTTLSGWAVDIPAHRAAQSIYVLLDQKLVTSCPVSEERPDVATALNDQVFATSGFICEIAASHVVTGRHTITLAIVSRGGRTYYSAFPHTVLDVR